MTSTDSQQVPPYLRDILGACSTMDYVQPILRAPEPLNHVYVDRWTMVVMRDRGPLRSQLEQ